MTIWDEKLRTFGWRCIEHHRALREHVRKNRVTFDLQTCIALFVVLHANEEAKNDPLGIGPEQERLNDLIRDCFRTRYEDQQDTIGIKCVRDALAHFNVTLHGEGVIRGMTLESNPPQKKKPRRWIGYVPQAKLTTLIDGLGEIWPKRRQRAG